jgi:hypothetical protein
MFQHHSVHLDIDQDCPRLASGLDKAISLRCGAPWQPKRSRRGAVWGQLRGLVLLMLLVTAVRGAEHAPIPTPGSASPQFVTVVLGAAGGLHEANLTAYLLAPVGEK